MRASRFSFAKASMSGVPKAAVSRALIRKISVSSSIFRMVLMLIR